LAGAVRDGAGGDGDLPAAARTLRHDPAIQNSTRLTRRLLEAGLVDELNITVAPVVVGEGRALFAGLKQRIDLRQAEVTRFDNGTVYVRYEVKPRPTGTGAA
jgi:dihydrofolate reductase